MTNRVQATVEVKRKEEKEPREEPKKKRAVFLG